MLVSDDSGQGHLADEGLLGASGRLLPEDGERRGGGGARDRVLRGAAEDQQGGDCGEGGDCQPAGAAVLRALLLLHEERQGVRAAGSGPEGVSAEHPEEAAPGHGQARLRLREEELRQLLAVTCFIN